MKSKFVSKFAVALALVSLAAVPTFASPTASLSLSGVVLPTLSISVTPDANASSLPVGSTVSNLKIGSVNELTNNKAGYTVSLASLNSGFLVESNKSGLGLTDSLHYTISYRGSLFDLSGGTAVISNIAQRTPGTGTDTNIYISFNAIDLNADTYSDTLTFTIAAK